MHPFEIGKKDDMDTEGGDSDAAVPLLSSTPNTCNITSDTFTVKVKSSDMGEVEVTVNVTATVDDLKAAVSRQLNIPVEKRVRLIAAGKLLDGPVRLTDFKVVDGSFIHCVVSNPPPAPVSAPSSSSSSSSSALLDGDEIFNSDIAFAMNRSATRAGTGGGSWLDSWSDPSLGTNSEFMWGVVMGYLLGGIMLFCVWDRNVSYRQKVGILIGVTLQVVLSVAQGQGQGQTAAPLAAGGPYGLPASASGQLTPAPAPGATAAAPTVPSSSTPPAASSLPPPTTSTTTAVYGVANATTSTGTSTSTSSSSNATNSVVAFAGAAAMAALHSLSLSIVPTGAPTAPTTTTAAIGTGDGVRRPLFR